MKVSHLQLLETAKVTKRVLQRMLYQKACYCFHERINVSIEHKLGFIILKNKWLAHVYDGGKCGVTYVKYKF